MSSHHLVLYWYPSSSAPSVATAYEGSCHCLVALGGAGTKHHHHYLAEGRVVCVLHGVLVIYLWGMTDRVLTYRFAIPMQFI